MKKYKWILGLFLLSGLTAGAQQKATVNPQKSKAQRPLTNRPATRPQASPGITGQTLNNVGTYGAKSPLENNDNGRLIIADPTIRAMQQIGTGEDLGVNPTRVVGTPKTAYGIANGRIKFYGSGAPSSGTLTGSGAVGTGSSPGSAGASYFQLGLNGKSPYAGSGMWGTATGLPLRDSAGMSSSQRREN